MLIAPFLLSAAFLVQAPSADETNRLIADLVKELDKGSARSIQHVRRDDNMGDFAAIALVKMGQKAVPSLIEALKSKSGWTRGHAAESLATLRVQAAFQPLLDALQTEEEPGLKGTFLQAAVECQGKGALNLVYEYAKSDDETLRRAAIRCFGILRDPASIPILVANLANRRKGLSGGDQLDTSALDSLIAIGQPAIPELLKALDCEDAFFRRIASSSIASIDNPAIGDYFLKALRKPKPERWLEYAIVRRKEPAFIPMLLDLLQSKDWDTKALAAYVLSERADQTCEATVAKEILSLAKFHAPQNGAGDRGEQASLIRFLSNAYGGCKAKPSIQSIHLALAALANRRDISDDCLNSLLRLLDASKSPPNRSLLVSLAQRGDAEEPWWEDPGRTAASMCAKLGHPAMKELRMAWRQGKIRLDVYADAVGSVRDPKCLPLLEETLKNGEKDLRQAALYALSKQPSGVGYVRRYLRDPDLGIFAARHLVEAGEASALDALDFGNFRAQFNREIFNEGFPKMSEDAVSKACLSPDPWIQFFAADNLLKRTNKEFGRSVLSRLCAEGPAELAERILNEYPLLERGALVKAFRRPEIRVRTAAYFALRSANQRS